MSTDTTETHQTQPDGSSQAPPLATTKRRPRSVTIPAELMTIEQPQSRETPTSLVRLAVEQNFDIDKLEKLLQLQRDWEAGEAKKAFFAALSKFQSELPPILKTGKADMGPKAGRRKFASLGAINEAIRPWLYANGLSFRFSQTQSALGITVTCIVSHCDGHSEETTLTAGADVSGGKNPIQSIGSTITYLERYTLVGALGLTTVDEDDDGGAIAEPEQELTPEQQRQRAMEIARAAAGVGAAGQPADPGFYRVVTATPTSPPAVTSPSPSASTPGITQQQLAEMMGLMRKLFASGAAASQWLTQVAATTDPAVLNESQAVDVLIALNRMAAEASMAAMPAAPGPDAGNARSAEPLEPPPTAPATPEQRLKIRDLTVRAYTTAAPQRQADWLQMLGHTSADQITWQQAEERTEYLMRVLGDIPF